MGVDSASALDGKRAFGRSAKLVVYSKTGVASSSSVTFTCSYRSDASV